ncbi:MAG TPA: ribosome maturation factor RimP [Mycobacteriales bacterium]|jgi:ribosome maturation factor RimP|nr:ribosome maturation factor RimP [Mycobacteriales bacterium]
MAGKDSSAVTRERLTALIEPLVDEAGFDLEELVLSRAGRRSMLRVIVDGEDGFSLDDAAELSRQISALLETPEADAAMGRVSYILEVTSPGVDRPLTLPRHWRRNQGRLVRAKTADGEVTGRVTRADDSSVTLIVDDEERTYSHDELGPGAVQLEFRQSRQTSPQTEETA